MFEIILIFKLNILGRVSVCTVGKQKFVEKLLQPIFVFLFNKIIAYPSSGNRV